MAKKVQEGGLELSNAANRALRVSGNVCLASGAQAPARLGMFDLRRHMDRQRMTQ